jgi:hypothetical protein
MEVLFGFNDLDGAEASRGPSTKKISIVMSGSTCALTTPVFDGARRDLAHPRFMCVAECSAQAAGLMPPWRVSGPIGTSSARLV